MATKKKIEVVKPELCENQKKVLDAATKFLIERFENPNVNPDSEVTASLIHVAHQVVFPR